MSDLSDLLNSLGYVEKLSFKAYHDRAINTVKHAVKTNNIGYLRRNGIMVLHACLFLRMRDNATATVS